MAVASMPAAFAAAVAVEGGVIIGVSTSIAGEVAAVAIMGTTGSVPLWFDKTNPIHNISNLKFLRLQDF